MWQPLCNIPKNNAINIVFIRTKFLKPFSYLKQEQKIKAYNKVNREIFGPLLETKKEKYSREKREAKNNTHLKNIEDKAEDKGNTRKFIDIVNHPVNCDKSYKKSSVETYWKFIQNKMWTKAKNCYSLAGLTFNNVPVRSLKISSVDYPANSTAQPGYESEDKILQIKEYQNDYTKQYPAVTLILNKTMTEQSRLLLNKWKEKRIAELGEEEFNRLYNEQMAIGTKFHSTLKTYFTRPLSELRIEKEVEAVWTSVSDVLKHISSPKAIESNVVHPVLKYRGIFDAIAEYEEKPMLIEWKKSDKPKTNLASTYDNPVQLAAYFGAVNNDLNYKHLNIRDALLVIAYTDGSKAAVFHLTTDKLRENWAQWLIRLKEFNKLYNSEHSEKRLEGGKRKFEEEIGNL